MASWQQVSLKGYCSLFSNLHTSGIGVNSIGLCGPTIVPSGEKIASFSSKGNSGSSGVVTFPSDPSGQTAIMKQSVIHLDHDAPTAVGDTGK